MFSARTAVAAIAACVLGLGLAPAADAALVVTRTDDPSPNACLPGDCSLREAVLAANRSGGEAKVKLSAGTYSLTRPAPHADNGFTEVGDLDITDDLKIAGVGDAGKPAKTIINGNGAQLKDRVFEIRGRTDVVMKHLYVHDGRALPSFDSNGDGEPDFSRGGAVLIGPSGHLEGTWVSFVGNTAEQIGQGGAVFNQGLIYLRHSTVSHNEAVGGFSGAIHTEPYATTNLEDSVLQFNQADFGGALGAYGLTTVDRTLIAFNEGGLGGGIRAAGEPSHTSLRNVTMAYNRSQFGGAAIQARSGAELFVNAATIARNTAGYGNEFPGDAAVLLRRDPGEAPTSIKLRNSILALNDDEAPAGGVVPDCRSQGASIVLDGYNLLGDASGCDFSESPATAGTNLIGTGTEPVDPKLGLEPDGEPYGTLSLSPTSLAIDTGSPVTPGSAAGACPATDQRGLPRTDCDMGAYELQD